MSTTTKRLPGVDRPVRVQRLVDELPPVHLEPDIPEAGPDWTVTVDGLVERPLRLSLPQLAELGSTEVVMDHHCVWGWSRRSCRFGGVPLGALLDHAGLRPGARVVTIACRATPYSSCLELADAREGVLAWELDGRPLAPENGWPLRFQNPPWLWGYKGVKWVGRVTVGERFEPGFWESRVADPAGRIPPELLLPFDTEEDL